MKGNLGTDRNLGKSERTWCSQDQSESRILTIGLSFYIVPSFNVACRTQTGSIGFVLLFVVGVTTCLLSRGKYFDICTHKIPWVVCSLTLWDYKLTHSENTAPPCPTPPHCQVTLILIWRSQYHDVMSCSKISWTRFGERESMRFLGKVVKCYSLDLKYSSKAKY